eukprot:gene22782-biopygen16281
MGPEVGPAFQRRSRGTRKFMRGVRLAETVSTESLLRDAVQIYLSIPPRAAIPPPPNGQRTFSPPEAISPPMDNGQDKTEQGRIEQCGGAACSCSWQRLRRCNPFIFLRGGACAATHPYFFLGRAGSGRARILKWTMDTAVAGGFIPPNGQVSVS